MSDAQVPPTYEEVVELNQRMATRLGNLTRDINEVIGLALRAALYQELTNAADDYEAETPAPDPATWLRTRALGWKPSDPRVDLS